MTRAKAPREQAAPVPAVFLAPDHDHRRCSAEAMAAAQTLCGERGHRLTPIRHDVLATLLASHQPLGAYDIMDRLSPTGPRPAPITVYRALDFLMDNGLVHKIESRNAFLACAQDHEGTPMVAFLICERCGLVGEVPAAPVAQSLTASARSTGFTPRMSIVEITGVCAHCQN